MLGSSWIPFQNALELPPCLEGPTSHGDPVKPASERGFGRRNGKASESLSCSFGYSRQSRANRSGSRFFLVGP